MLTVGVGVSRRSARRSVAPQYHRGELDPAGEPRFEKDIVIISTVRGCEVDQSKPIIEDEKKERV